MVNEKGFTTLKQLGGIILLQGLTKELLDFPLAEDFQHGAWFAHAIFHERILVNATKVFRRMVWIKIELLEQFDDAFVAADALHGRIEEHIHQVIQNKHRLAP
ncbi:MAG: hypothetical protein AAFY20_05150 [Cyanobacteria bacterium J06639_14]